MFFVSVTNWIFFNFALLNEFLHNIQAEEETTLADDVVVTGVQANDTIWTISTNSTSAGIGNYLYDTYANNKGLVLRSFYVLLVATAIVLLYMGVRWWRLVRESDFNLAQKLLYTGFCLFPPTPRQGQTLCRLYGGVNFGTGETHMRAHMT